MHTNVAVTHFSIRRAGVHVRQECPGAHARTRTSPTAANEQPAGSLAQQPIMASHRSNSVCLRVCSSVRFFGADVSSRGHSCSSCQYDSLIYIISQL